MKSVAQAGSRLDFPATEQWLVAGGDARIALDPVSGLNKYGCPPVPDPSLLDFASSTSSVISRAGFAAANRLRERLLVVPGTFESALAVEMRRIRLALLADVSDPGTQLVFAGSGTDAHALAARYAASVGARPLTVVMVEDDETGSGVAAALYAVETGGAQIEVLKVPLRQADGAPRLSPDIDTEVTVSVQDAVSAGRRVLLVMVDQSKTGMIAPAVACVDALHRRYPGEVEVLVDVCQFRIAPLTLRAYLQRGFMVALTGSKFLAGPSFSAALLFPAAISHGIAEVAGLGLLMRWEAALTELQRFRAVPQQQVAGYLRDFARAMGARLMNDPHFAALPVPQLDRRPLQEAADWDGLPSIFPFLLYHPKTRMPFSREQTLAVYRQLPVATGDGIAALRCQFGQPVACGTRQGVGVSALRLCLSARLISDAAEYGIDRVICDAQAALDKTAYLVDSISNSAVIG